MSNWLGVQETVAAAELDQLVDAAVRDLAGLPLRVRFRRKELGSLAGQAVRKLVGQRGLSGRLSPTQSEALIGRVVALVGGFGFLEGLIPPRCNDYTDLTVNADGIVRGRRKGTRTFERLSLAGVGAPGQPDDQERWRAEVWRTVEALLTPQQRACTEATPTVDIKIPRDREIGFGGARVKVIHPCLAPGDGFPVLAVRLFEPEPVSPAQIVEWGVFPRAGAGEPHGVCGPAAALHHRRRHRDGQDHPALGDLPWHSPRGACGQDRGPGRDLAGPG